MVLKECLTEAFTEALNGGGDEGFDGWSMKRGSRALAAFIVFIVYVVIILLIGKFLWNAVVVNLVSIAKKADNIWQILGLAILLHFLYA